LNLTPVSKGIASGWRINISNFRHRAILLFSTAKAAEIGVGTARIRMDWDRYWSDPKKKYHITFSPDIAIRCFC